MGSFGATNDTAALMRHSFFNTNCGELLLCKEYYPSVGVMWVKVLTKGTHLMTLQYVEGACSVKVLKVACTQGLFSVNCDGPGSTTF